ncbi:hypothetical protein SERLA73DRAFT_78547 [Serpula lacrymans var. lacrymans S7.3]|uniref:Integrase core domain-containing protein n=2 Tax=Serpula lacrymans var. lacrymans TaxID=341189 RepID=F8QDL1_SERL3|nr:uncharacterized protein SERLADRAFT_411947 [Serpula lacrymans var. lacrymans S7.9]EGN93682.1 hypothetical protein SERLA73DRAFT_78547 [Serpula lacrymans var. lacrymans S7.3]EGO19055.1 hypothetical protein SERLADRAFT_411947 [Serpula lacrymans var. lacrymans S7.9]
MARTGLVNQNKPNPPIETIKEIILHYWKMKKNDKEILDLILKKIDRSKFGLEQEAMPLVTQSDPGSENYGIANAHTMLRQMHDPALMGTLQHRWMRIKKNIKLEIAWSQLRRRFILGFEDILDKGVVNNWYDADIDLQRMVFHWVFIPWLQCELDSYCDRVNNTQKRADKNKILPHGVPNHIFETPEDFGAYDCKVIVSPDAVEHVRNLYAPKDHAVFELVPVKFSALAEIFYNGMGHPAVERETVWPIYCALLCQFEQYKDNAAQDEWLQDLARLQDITTKDVAKIVLLDGMDELPNGMDKPRPDGSYYMGGVNKGHGPVRNFEDDGEQSSNHGESYRDLLEDGQLVASFSSENEMESESVVDE